MSQPFPQEPSRSSRVDPAAPTPSVSAPHPTDTSTGRARPARRGGLRSILEWIGVVGGAVVVALLLQTYVFQAFYIPSESMELTLQENDRVLVNKLSYRFGEVSRGDVIVFRKPEGTTGLGFETDDLIKRVIGLPGDTLVFDDGHVHIDGVRIEEPYLAPGATTQPGSGVPDPGAPHGVVRSCTSEEPCTVPDGHFFVMGDNRNHSKDSRWRDLGYVAEEDVVGRAFLRIWPPGRFGRL